MIDNWVFWAAAIPAVILMGMAKGGFSGFGALAMPIMALAISPVQAAGILLPILIVQDVVSVWAFRKTWNKYVLSILIPGAIVGIVLGYLLAAQVNATVMLAVLGVISIVFALYRLWLTYGGKPAEVKPHAPLADKAIGIVAGIFAGFTSQVAHAGQAPFQIWVLPKNLPRDSLIGTTSIFFATINWIKVPAYIALNQFTPQNLATTGALLPIAIISTLAGVRLVRLIDAEKFYTMIYVMMIFVGGLLLWEVFN
jgi:uncharacterized membrane protein YfcA